MNIGSEWNKWDLHIHTPYSIEQQYGELTDDIWEDYITALENLPKEVKVIGINDYYFIDGYERVMKEKLQNNRLPNIDKIFPLLEYRIDTFGTASNNKFSKVNLHILFDVDEEKIQDEIELIRTKFSGAINLSKLPKHKSDFITKKDFLKNSSKTNEDEKLKDVLQNIIPNTEDVFEMINSELWKDKTLTFLGYNEWFDLSRENPNQLNLFKEDLYNNVKFFFTASQTDVTTNKEEVLKYYGNRKLLHSFDIHNFNELKAENYKCYTWIKSTPTFKGLKQTLIEPEERLLISDENEYLKYISQNKQFYIDKITISSDDITQKNWFDKTPEITFNTGLCAIIGNKGSGKSALADIIALSGNYKGFDNYTFLNPSKFLALPESRKYSTNIYFKDNYTNKKDKRFNLNSRPEIDDKNIEKVVYLSQTFVNKLCDSPDNSTNKLQQEIDRVVFSHIPEEKTYGKNDLKAIIDIETKSFTKDIEKLQLNIDEVNSIVIDLEAILSSEYLETKQKELVELQRLLDEKEKEKPIAVKKPNSIKNELPNFLLSKYNNWIRKLEIINKSKQESLNLKNIQLSKIEDVVSKLNTVENTYAEIKNEIQTNDFYAENKLIVDDLITIEIKKDKIDEIKKTINNTISDIQKSKNNTAENTIPNLKNKIAYIKTSLDDAEKDYQDYVELYNIWKSEYEKIIGDIKTKATIKYIENEIEKIKNEYPKQLQEAYEIRKEIGEKIVKQIILKNQKLSDIYVHAQSIANEKADCYKIKPVEFIQFKSEISFIPTFISLFFDYIAQNVSGTFYGRDNGREELKKIMLSVDFSSINSIAEFPEKCIAALNNNLANGQCIPNSIEYQIRSNKNKKSLYNFLYQYNYINSEIVLNFENSPVGILSPGQKGILLLVFFLLIDKDKRPIIIDQPEENLDNETVYQKLVKFIRDVKKQRQIFIVTHNPNLAIVCDAEQIIKCDIKKNKKDLVRYVSGSIEMVGIKNSAINILEGTEPAFNNRRMKYEL